MAKLLMILFIGLVFESTGIVLLKKGMNAVGEVRACTVAEIGRVLKAGVTNSQILLGILFQALFFACLLILMARSQISFLWPLTALSFVFATLSARWFLHENISPIRWTGVVFILIGAGLISYSEHIRKKPEPTTPPVASVDR